jgi:hypothetical protein
MERNLTDEEVRGTHRQHCSACKDLARDGEGVDHVCHCDDPAIDALCALRVPGARNWECPSVQGMGHEELRLEMQRQDERGRLIGGAGVSPAINGRRDACPTTRGEEVWQFGDYLPSRGV